MTAQTCAERVSDALAPYLGAFNAKVTVKTFAQRSLGVPAEALTAAQLPRLLDALRPTLYTLVGRVSADSLLEQIQREVA